ncbi:MAG: 5-amino-6-(D-ribitylamino)uracil--L-tyrosine 4-hydroxyphenyl transferase CofH [Alphaproteobacteria bacterium]
MSVIHRQKSLEAWLAAATPAVARSLGRALEGREVSVEEGEALFRTDGDDLSALLATADRVRQQRAGDDVSFVINRNINFTNICYMGCKFCGFAKRRDDPEAEVLSLEEIQRRTVEAHQRGATEVCIQGGLNPKLGHTHYRVVTAAVREAVPSMHVHAFSPFEIWYGSARAGMPASEFILDLKDAGLGSMPGTAAEILDTEIRQRLTRDKLTAAQWVDIIRAAHSVGMPTTATIMYGHIDGPPHWSRHIDLIRSIQKDTGGFTEFVPLGFIHFDSPLYLNEKGVRPGPTNAEHLRMHAVARLMLAGWIDNIQASWVKLGPGLAQAMLDSGCNDFGGSLMNESISRAAGAPHGQEVTPAEMVALIRAAGRRPVRRSTVYEILETFDDHDPVDYAPLVERAPGVMVVPRG